MTGLDLGLVATTFLLIFPAELPDKTFVASLVLATRYPRLAVWLGVVAAFGVQCLIAVTAGGLLALLPDRVVALAAGVLFALGSLVMLRSGLRARSTWAAEVAEEEGDVADDMGHGDGDPGALDATRRSGFGVAFALIFVAEWGDLSQLLTAGIAARTGQPVSVFVGAWAALAAVAGVAVLVGGWLTQHVPLHRIRLVSAALLAVLAALAFSDALRG